MKLHHKIKQQISKITKNSLLVNVMIVATSALLIKGISFFKDLVIADQYGLSELLDTFLIAFLIPGFISTVFLGAFKSVFIPNYVAEQNTTRKIGAFQGTMLLITLSSSIFFIIIAILFTDVYIQNFFPGHTDQYYALVKLQFYYMIPCLVFWGLSSLLKGLLTIDNEFTFSSLNTIFTPIAIIVCIIFFRDNLGVKVLAIGTLIGSVFNFFYLFILARKRRLINIERPDFKLANVKILLRQVPAKLSSGLISGFNTIVDQYFSAQLIVGSIAALNFGTKIPALAIGVIAIAINNVFLPYFSKSAILDKAKSFTKLGGILKKIMILSAILVVILIFISTPVVSLLFERNQFTSDDTQIVSKIQQMYLLQVPFYLGGLIIVKYLTAINKNVFMVYTSINKLVLNIILNIILMKAMGVEGLALATSIVAFIHFIILFSYVIHLKRKNIFSHESID